MIGVGIPARLVDDSGRVDPAACPLATPVSDRARAEAIVARYGRQPLDFFKLWPDKSHFFSPVGRCVIAYQVAWRVAVSLGDPAGPDAALEPTAKGS